MQMYVHCSGLHCVESALCGAVCRHRHVWTTVTILYAYYVWLTYIHTYILGCLLSLCTTHRDYCKEWTTGSLTCLPSEGCLKVCTIYLPTCIYCVSTYLRMYLRMCVYRFWQLLLHNVSVYQCVLLENLLLCNNDSNVHVHVHQASVFLCLCVSESVRLCVSMCVCLSVCVCACVRACMWSNCD